MVTLFISSLQIPTSIWAQELTPDGISLFPSSTRSELFRNSLLWEGALVEGPWVISRAPYVNIVYSANAYYNASYAMGVARTPIKSFFGPN